MDVRAKLIGFTEHGYHRRWTLPLQKITAQGNHRRWRLLIQTNYNSWIPLLIDATATEDMDTTADERYRCRTFRTLYNST